MIVAVIAKVSAWRCLQCGWTWAHGKEEKPFRCANPRCRKLATWTGKRKKK